MVETVLLREVARIDRKSIAPEKIETGSKYVGLENIESGGRLINVGTVANGELASSKFMFTREHVLYGKLRPYLAKIALPEFDGICSTDIVPVLPGSKLDRRFLVHFLRQPNSVRLANSLATGANLPRLSPAALGEMVVPLLPLDEQRRIAAILDKVDVLRTKRRKALAQLDDLTQSIFHAMFGDPVNNSRGWRQQKLSTLGRITTGNTPSRAVAENFGDYIEWVKTDNINTPQTTLTRAKEGLSEQGAKKARTVPSGSILVTCIAGSPGVIGNVALVDRTVAFNQQINAFTPNAGPSLYWYALLKSMKPLIQNASSGGMKGLVSKTSLSAVDAIVVPEAIQSEFAERLALVELLKERHSMQLADLNALFASLQRRAFSGQL